MTELGLYQYYQQATILPTHARLASEEDLRCHDERRKRLFNDLLHLPPQWFHGTRVLEFGPDSGENSLVFARWGANVTLVEPNPNAWPHITNYFQHFGLSDRLRALEKVSLEQFDTAERFQIIDAEGFIYTVRPEAVWMDLFHRLLEPNGFAILFYYEMFGSLFELMLKAIYARGKTLTGETGREVAWRLFGPKWDSLPHSRSFDSWVMDVLENPFVRLRYFFNADALLRQLAARGFSLYTSWPRYTDGLEVLWHKTERSLAQQLQQNAWFIARNRLSMAFGRKLFLSTSSDELVAQVTVRLEEILVAVDHLIDGFDSDALTRCIAHLDILRGLVHSEAVLADSSHEKQRAIEMLDSLRTVMGLLAAEDLDALVSFCGSDAGFIRSWGVPGHFAVIQKTHEALPS